MPADILTTYAGAQPGKMAVVDDRPDGSLVQWTYAEFEAHANRMAHALLALGAAPRSKIISAGRTLPR